MTGLDLAREIRKVRPEIPILLCTGFIEKDAEAAVKEYGINRVIMKPLNQQKIAEAIRKVLDKKNI